MMLNNVEAERGRFQFTKEVIAEKLDVTTTTYNRYINETSPIPSDKLNALSTLFGCSIDYLLGWTDNRNRAS